MYVKQELEKEKPRALVSEERKNKLFLVTL